MTDRYGIEPVRRATLGATVTERLRELVVGGGFEPGTVLSEVDLATRFGVSRGPVREALLHLLQEGLLRRAPRRGVAVPVVDEADIADLHLARHAIEREALRIVVERRPDGLAEELATITALMTDAAEDGNLAVVAECDIAFHSVIVRAAASPRLTRMWSSVADETRAHLSVAVRDPGMRDVIREHAEIARLLGAGGPANLMRAVVAHTGPRRGGVSASGSPTPRSSSTVRRRGRAAPAIRPAAEVDA